MAPCPYSNEPAHRCSRLLDWWPRLWAALDACGSRRFEYGHYDCCLFTSTCLVAVTGTDYRSRFPDYHDEAGAQLLLNKLGGVEGILTSCLGSPVEFEDGIRGLWMSGDVNHPRDGDIILADSRYGPTAGIVFMGGCVFASSQDAAGGLWNTGPRVIRKVWRVT